MTDKQKKCIDFICEQLNIKYNLPKDCNYASFFINKYYYEACRVYKKGGIKNDNRSF